MFISDAPMQKDHIYFGADRTFPLNFGVSDSTFFTAFNIF